MNYDVHALSGAYAVDALDDIERAQFDRHLVDCAACRGEVDSLREAAALIAETSTLTPSASLRSRVLDEIAQVRPLPPIVQPSAASDSAGRRRIRPLVLVAAAVVLIMGAVGAAFQPWSDPRPDLTATERVLSADDARRVTQTFEDGAKATVVISDDLDQAVIVTEGMSPPPEGKVYELWFQDVNRGLVPAGLMPRDSADATVLLEGDASNAVAVKITEEPLGGTTVPTSAPFAVFELKQA